MTQATSTPEHAEIHARLLEIVAGRATEPALYAVADTLAGLVAYLADDIAGAERLLDALVPDMKAYIRQNWDRVSTVKLAAAQPAGSA